MKKGYQTVDVSTPRSGLTVMTDKYWLCKDGDPKQALFYGHTAQCNTHKQIPERMIEYTKRETGWNVEVVFIPIAYRPNVAAYYD